MISRWSAKPVAVAVAIALVSLLVLANFPVVVQPVTEAVPQSAESLDSWVYRSSPVLDILRGKYSGYLGLVRPEAQFNSLEEAVTAAIGSEPGFWAVYINNLETGEQYAMNADEQLNVASLYKLQVMYTVYADERAGLLSLDEVLPEGMTVSDALNAMITVSDQDATFALLRRVGTERVGAMMAELGLGQSYVTDWGYSTARETGTLLELMAMGEAVDAAASQEMVALLSAQQINDRLPAYLPGGTVAHKTGELPGTRNDAGIVYGPNGPYVIVVATSGLPDEDAGASAIAQLSLNVYEYFS